MAVLIKDIFPNLVRVPRTLGHGFIFYFRRNKCLLSICPECLLSITAIRNIGSVKDMDNSDRWAHAMKGLVAQNDTAIVADKQAQRTARGEVCGE